MIQRIKEDEIMRHNAGMPHQVHDAILQRDKEKPFESLRELYAFVYTYAANLPVKEFMAQRDMLMNFKRLIKLPPRGVLEVVGSINPWRPRPVQCYPQWEMS